MSVKIRLRRTGARNAACFRVVAAEATSPRDGRFIETLGWYDPNLDGKNFEIKADRINHWISQGAEISDSVNSILRRDRRAEAGQSA